MVVSNHTNKLENNTHAVIHNNEQMKEFYQHKLFFEKNNKSVKALGKHLTGKGVKVGIIVLKVFACLSIIGILPVFLGYRNYFRNKGIKQIQKDNISRLSQLEGEDCCISKKAIMQLYKFNILRKGEFINNSDVRNYLNVFHAKLNVSEYSKPAGNERVQRPSKKKVKKTPKAKNVGKNKKSKEVARDLLKKTNEMSEERVTESRIPCVKVGSNDSIPDEILFDLF